MMRLILLAIRLLILLSLRDEILHDAHLLAGIIDDFRLSPLSSVTMGGQYVVVIVLTG